MRTRIAVSWVVLFAVTTFAQDKKPEAPKNLYPLAKGTKWEYATTTAGQKQEVKTEVTAVSDKGVATITSLVGGQTVVEELSSDSKGVYKHALLGQKLDTPVTILTYPATDSAKWQATTKSGGQDITVDFHMQKPEAVKVTAGEFQAHLVEMKINVGGLIINAKNWYADGVGMVQQKLTIGLIESTTELIKFTPAAK